MSMIGQYKLRDYLTNCVNSHTLPRFLIFRGVSGIGKRTAIRFLAELLGCDIASFPPSVEGVRDLISLCYSQTSLMIYTMSNINTLSVNAINSLLKISEEPPSNAIIVLCTNTDKLLDTIRSRAVILDFESYTLSDKMTYAVQLGMQKDSVETSEICEIADTLYDIDKLYNCDLSEISQLCSKIILNIDKVSESSILQLSSKFKLSDSDSKGNLIDIELFLKCLKYHYMKSDMPYKVIYDNCILINKCLSDISNNCNKLMVLDNLWFRLGRVIYGNV